MARTLCGKVEEGRELENNAEDRGEKECNICTGWGFALLVGRIKDGVRRHLHNGL